ncbi:TolC family protein [uncultured Paludibaculum sp.]|uniref:TolC family protein n=1 Tax=uncultured Paludibaculum sp. TaxID=1765020 RepID=UPI002AAB212D|nr:TolC family protein [uncultured Paludibaculum sp.]
MNARASRLIFTARRYLAAGLCVMWPVTPMLAQPPIEPARSTAAWGIRTYSAATVPPIRTKNSDRLASMMRAGKLYLTVQDAIALALENSIDIEVARYGPLTAQWQLTRAEAGGSLPGVPSGASQAQSVASGQGVLGSQAAAGVSSGNNGTTNRAGGNATITQVGPVTQNLDPTIKAAITFSHRSLPQPNNIQSVTPILVQDQRVYTSSIQQGLLSGGSVTLSYNSNYLSENSPSNVLNPSVAPRMTLQFQHNLLRGFGLAVNSRTITVSRNSLKNSGLSFRNQVTSTVVRVLNAYYALVADHESLKSKQSALEVADRLLTEGKRKVEVGTLAEGDMIAVESQAATARLDLVNAQTALRQQELQLKNLLSRNGISDPLLAAAQIIPVDRLAIPDQEPLPPLQQLVEKAVAQRPDIALQKANLTNSEISALGTKNGVLPSLQVFGSTTNAGLAGTGRTVSGSAPADPYFVGGLGTAMGQVFRRNFPSQSIGAFVQLSVYNRQAQADSNIGNLQLRQSELALQKDLKQLQVDIMNAIVALEQSKARYEAAVKSRTLAEELLQGEQRKFELGASTPTDIIRQQRDLTTAQASEVSTLVNYTNARILLDQTIGSVLETNHVELSEVTAGKIAAAPSVPPVSSEQK